MTQIDSETQCQMIEGLGDSYGVVGKIEQPKVDRNSTGRLIKSTNLDTCVLPVSETPTKDHAEADPRHASIYIADIQLGLHMISEQLKQKAIPRAVAYLWDTFF